MSNGHFYDLNTFRDVYTAMNMALQDHYAGMIFGGDNTRIIYSSTEYALRRRAEDHANLNIPFMNYRMDEIVNDTDRAWFNHMLNVDGIFVPELNRKMRMSPVTITYDATLFYHKYRDTLYGYTNLLWDDSNETIVQSTIEIEGQDVLLPGVLGYNLSFTPTYNENDWLERNNISTIAMNFEVQTFIILDNVDISIPETILFGFLVKNGYDMDQVDDVYQATLDHLSEAVSDFSNL